MQTVVSEEADLLVGLFKRFPVLEAVQADALDRAGLERQLDVSKATSYRFTNWLEERALVEESDGEFTLTALGRAITEAVTAFEAVIVETVRPEEAGRDLLADVIRQSSVLSALRDEPSDRREIEQRLGVSKSSSHRYTRALGDLDLIEKSEGRYTLTAAGEAIEEAAATCLATVRLALHLAPVLEADATRDATAFDLERFAGATVTRSDYGDPYGPMTRFITLLQRADTLRGINSCMIAPTYIDEFQQRIIDGMTTELVDPPQVAEDIMDRYPEKCVEVCVSGHLTLWLHDVDDELPFGLVLFDDRVGIAVFDSFPGKLRTFVDTDSPGAIEWAEAVYTRYRAEAIHLETFTKTGLRTALRRAERAR